VKPPEAIVKTMEPTIAASGESTGHHAATLGATLAGLDAVVQAANALAIFCTFSANFRTFPAYVLMVGRIKKHEVRGRAANFGACHHKPEMLGFDGLASGLQTMRHGRSETGLIAAQAFVDTGLDVFAHMFHRMLLAGFKAAR
jgi:hypothetical protein